MEAVELLVFQTYAIVSKSIVAIGLGLPILIHPKVALHGWMHGAKTSTRSRGKTEGMFLSILLKRQQARSVAVTNAKTLDESS